jgi:hypothetical protein
LIRRVSENPTSEGIASTNALLGSLLANEEVRALRLFAGYSLGDEASQLTLNTRAA